MTDKERSEVIAVYIKQIVMAVDLILADDDNLTHLKDMAESLSRKVSTYEALPFLNISKAEKARIESDLISAIVGVCDIRVRQRNHKVKEPLGDSLFRVLGLDGGV